MNLDKYQVNPLLDKLYSEIKANIMLILHGTKGATCEVKIEETDKKKIKSITFSHINDDGTPRGKIVAIREHIEGLEVSLHIHGNRVEGIYRIRFQLINPTWWKWKKITRLIERNTNRLRELNKQVKANELKERFNDAYVNIFPDEVNRILLGGDDD